MACQRPALPTLAIPDNDVVNAGSPSGNSSTTQTGRPSLWKASAQRKMARLYVYTTLPLDKILEVVNVTSPAEAVPGCVGLVLLGAQVLTARRKDSANKKLNANLDKEPRWLHPRSNTDMGRRITELSHSPTRSPVFPSSTFGRPKAKSEPLRMGPYATFNNAPGPGLAAPFANWAASSPGSTLHGNDAFTDDTAFSHGPAQASCGNAVPPTNGRGFARRTGSGTDTLFEAFLRRTTHLTSSTDHTTGTFHRLLHDKSEPYIQTVRRLVKRFTLTANPRMSMSPISERPQTAWDDDADAPAFSEQPFPLAGDFLNPETLRLSKGPCVPGSEQHETRQCLCYVDDDLPDSPWVLANGLTQAAQQIFQRGVTERDARCTDDYGNTVLHFIVARGSMELFLHALQTKLCGPILNHRNTAGQTFLHLATPQWLKDYPSLRQLLHVLQSQSFDMYAQDHYGRTVFHVFLRLGLDVEKLSPFYDGTRSKRDAFNTNLHLQSAPGGVNPSYLATTELMDLDMVGSEQFLDLSRDPADNPEVVRESKLVQNVRLAQEKPLLEDEDGNNGLHCLALASLSFANVAQKADPGSRAALELPASADRSKKKQADPANQLDSSREKLQLRLSLVQNLIAAGVDVNHYNHAGNTPLMAFAAQLPEDDDYKTGREILDLLIKSGANVHARNRVGETALHIAVRCGRKLAVRALVEKRANVHVRDAAKRSLLDVADIKMKSSNYDVPKEYSHYEACRAWLSGQGRAVQRPTANQEWRA
jgi:ankyrin repeat protein